MATKRKASEGAGEGSKRAKTGETKECTPGYFQTKAYACQEAKGPLEPFTLERRNPTDDDIHIKVKFAGICHSDIHTGRGEWGEPIMPLVPGHEIGGVVVAVGKNVKKFKVGDHAGVGCMVDSCRDCSHCNRGNEQYCVTRAVMTYNSREKYSHCPGHVEGKPEESRPTYGGYCQDMVVNHKFAVLIPKALDLAAATPLLCAGITVYSPMMHYGLRPNMRVGVAGLGGLAHVAIKIALAMGCHVTVISRGTKKKADALENLKADRFIDSTNPEEMKAGAESIEFLVDTIAAGHDLAAYLGLVAINGQLVMVGGSPEPLKLPVFTLIPRRKSVCGSMIGGIHETQEMMDFCGYHNITCDIEMVKGPELNTAWDRCVASDVKYRFVLDTATL